MHSSTAKHGDRSTHGDTAVREHRDESENEFRFLASDAERVGRVAPLPDVRRVEIPLSSGRTASALAFSPDRDPELVLLHGAGLNAHGFDPMMLALDRPGLAVDLPGHGRSDWRDDADYRPETLAPDVVEVIAARTRRPVALVGHSLGALASALVAAARPDLVSALVMVDLTPGVVPRRDASAVHEFITGQRDFAALEDIVDRAIRFGIGADRRALTRGVALNTRRRPDGRWEWIHHLAHLDRAPTGGASADRASARPYSALWEAIADLDVPVTLIRADRGMVDETAAAQWRERLPRAPVVTVHGPHNLHEAAPAALAAEIAAALPTHRE